VAIVQDRRPQHDLIYEGLASYGSVIEYPDFNHLHRTQLPLFRLPSFRRIIEDKKLSDTPMFAFTPSFQRALRRLAYPQNKDPKRLLQGQLHTHRMGEYRIDYEEIWRNEDNGYKGPMSTKLYLQSWKEQRGEQNNGMTLSFQAFQRGISIIRAQWIRNFKICPIGACSAGSTVRVYMFNCNTYR